MKTARPGIKIKPLDGSPMMSSNCWQAVLDTLDKRAQLGKRVRFLEWGPGNSTISSFALGLSSSTPFEITSVEHDTDFFSWLGESVIEIALTKSTGEVFVKWQPLKTISMSHTEGRQIIRNKRELTSLSLNWQILWNNKRLEFIDGSAPRYGFPVFTIAKQLCKRLLVEAAFWTWYANARLRRAIHGGTKMIEPGDSTFEKHRSDYTDASFYDYFEANREPGLLTITAGKSTVLCWHLPHVKNIFWKKGLLLDGSAEQLAAFLAVPLSGEYDVVFVDGRARVPCIKRAHRDALVVNGGSLFVHDAFRAEMSEGFKLFMGHKSFIAGNNVTFNGSVRCKPDYGLPLALVGDSLETRKVQIVRELFVWENTHTV